MHKRAPTLEEEGQDLWCLITERNKRRGTVQVFSLKRCNDHDIGFGIDLRRDRNNTFLCREILT